MTPYYQQPRIQIYLGDCREVLPYVHASVVIADPPYNTGKDYGQHDDSMPIDEYRNWLKVVLRLCRESSDDGVIFFPGTANLLDVKPIVIGADLRPVATLGWHKREFAGDKWAARPAMCWEPIIWASKAEKPFYNKIFGTSGRDFLVVNSTHNNPFALIHPCPKPMPVMRWLVSLFAPNEGTVIDPCCGTGTTLRAAKDLGRCAIGIEIEEKYCEIAAKRLNQEVFDFSEALQTMTANGVGLQQDFPYMEKA